MVVISFQPRDLEHERLPTEFEQEQWVTNFFVAVSVSPERTKEHGLT